MMVEIILFSKHTLGHLKVAMGNLIVLGQSLHPHLFIQFELLLNHYTIDYGGVVMELLFQSFTPAVVNGMLGIWCGYVDINLYMRVEWHKPKTCSYLLYALW